MRSPEAFGAPQAGGKQRLLDFLGRYEATLFVGLLVDPSVARPHPRNALAHSILEGDLGSLFSIFVPLDDGAALLAIDEGNLAAFLAAGIPDLPYAVRFAVHIVAFDERLLAVLTVYGPVAVARAVRVLPLRPELAIGTIDF